MYNSHILLQGPMQRKLSGISTKTMTNAANRANRANSLKKTNSVEDGEVNLQAAWVSGKMLGYKEKYLLPHCCQNKNILW